MRNPQSFILNYHSIFIIFFLELMVIWVACGPGLRSVGTACGHGKVVMKVPAPEHRCRFLFIVEELCVGEAWIEH